MEIKNVITWLSLLVILVTVIAQNSCANKDEVEKKQTEQVVKEIKTPKLTT